VARQRRFLNTKTTKDTKTIRAAAFVVLVVFVLK
jgi:hypothetical protein